MAEQFQAIKTKLVPKKGKKESKSQAKPTLHTLVDQPVKFSQEQRATMTIKEVQNGVLVCLAISR